MVALMDSKCCWWFVAAILSWSTTLRTTVAPTLQVLAEATGNIYPVGQNQTPPDLFWDGFEF
jgi:hypothetical protein